MTGGIVMAVAHMDGLAHITVGLGVRGSATVTLSWPSPTCGIERGDEVQWRGECAIWTPKDRAFSWQAWVVDG